MALVSMFQRSVSEAAVIFLAGRSQSGAFHTNVAAGARVRSSGESAKAIAVAEVVAITLVFTVVISAISITMVIIPAISIPVVIITTITITILVTMVITVLKISRLWKGLSSGR